MMLSSLIQHRTEACHIGPALAWQHTRLRRSARLARDRTANPVEQPAIRSFAQHARPRFELKRSDRQHRLNFPNTHADAKSP